MVRRYRRYRRYRRSRMVARVNYQQRFKVVSAGGGKIALKGGRSRFRNYCRDEGNMIKCQHSKMRTFDGFRVENLGGGKIYLRGGNRGKHCVDGGSSIKCI